MPQVIWSPEATRDLEGICQHVRRGSAPYAELFAEQVFALTRSIPDQPLLGAVVPEYGLDDLRERLVQNYRIMYRLRGNDVEIVAVIHGSRRLPRTPPN